MRKTLLAGLFSILLIACSLLIISACTNKKGDDGNQPTVGELTIDPNYMPQILYPEGQELNLTSGRLIDSDKNIISMTDPGVSISGYDKNTLGTQTVTLTYKGKSVDMIITVVPRFQPAQDYVYFVGDKFDAVNPSITVTRNNGTRITINKPYIGLTYTGFDTSKPAENVTINATYQAGSESYTGTFNITVEQPVYTFNPPFVVDYGSHETQLSLNGASLIITNEANTVKRTVPASNLTTEGFDPSAVNAENTEEEQTIKILYNGIDTGKSFNVTVTYSDVSRFIDFAAKCPDADKWVFPTDDGNGEASDIPSLFMPEGSQELGEQALEMLESYSAMTATDRAYISQNVLERVARVGVIYGYNTWYSTWYNDTQLQHVVSISNAGEPVYFYTDENTTVTRDEYVAVAERLLKNDYADDATLSKLAYIGAILGNDILLDELGDTNVYMDSTETPMNSILDWYVKDATYMRSIGNSLNKAVEVYDLLDDFSSPAQHSGWLTSDMTSAIFAREADVKEAYDGLQDILGYFNTQYLDPTVFDMGIFMAINNFRENDDYFEILYRYYFNHMISVAEDESLDSEAINNAITADAKAITQLTAYYIPMPLLELARAYSEADLYRSLLETNANNVFEEGADNMLSETTLFMAAFYNAFDSTEAFFNTYLNPDETDELYAYLYTYEFALDSVYTELFNGSYGYKELTSASAYDQDVSSVWAKYIDVWNAYLKDNELINSENNSEDAVAFRAKVADMFQSFMALDTAQQNYFMNALNYLYYTYSPEFVLYPDSNGAFGSVFTQLIYTYYYEMMGVDLTNTEETTGEIVFTNLMLAIECYFNGDIENFYEVMTEAKAAYDGEWNGNCTVDEFNTLLGDIYDKYVDYLAMYKKTQAVDDPDTTDKDESVDAEGNPVYEYNYDMSKLSEEDKAMLEKIDTALGNSSISSFYIELGMPLQLPYIVSYEQTRSLVAQIEPGSELEKAFLNYSTIYFDYYTLHGTVLNTLDDLSIDYSWYDGEEADDLHSFLAKYGDYFYYSTIITIASAGGNDLTGVFTYMNGEPELTSEFVSGMLTDYIALSSTSRNALLTLDQLELFFSGLRLGIEFSDTTDTTASAAVTVFDNLLSSYIFSLAYVQNPDATIEIEEGQAPVSVKTLMLNAFSEFETSYGNLSAELKTEFDSFFTPMVTYTSDICDSAQAEA